MRLKHALDDFIVFLRLKNLSSRTIEEYDKILNQLLVYFGKGFPLSQVTTAQLRKYVIGLRERGLAAKTIHNHVIVIKGFFGYLLAEGRIEEDPCKGIPNPQVGKRLPKALSVSETKRLFACFDGGSGVAKRDEIFFRLLYACGLRISEAVNLRVKDLDASSGTLHVVGKGDKERYIYLKPRLLDELKKYIEQLGVETYLFPGRGGQVPITVRNMEMRFKIYVKKAGLPDHITPHTLRHSIAVHYLINGAPITFVQRLLGHESLATTGIYTKLTDRLTKEIALGTRLALDDREGNPWDER